MMYRVTLYDWVNETQIGEPYLTNVMPTPGLLVSSGCDGTWSVVNVLHQVQQPGSVAAREKRPELLQVMAVQGKGQFQW